MCRCLSGGIFSFHSPSTSNKNAASFILYRKLSYPIIGCLVYINCKMFCKIWTCLVTWYQLHELLWPNCLGHFVVNFSFFLPELIMFNDYCKTDKFSLGNILCLVWEIRFKMRMKAKLCWALETNIKQT